MDTKPFQVGSLEPHFSKRENFLFWKNLILIGIFFLITPLTLFISLFSIYSLHTTSISKVSPIVTYNSSFSGIQVYAALPVKFPAITGEVGVGDARTPLVKSYLKFYNSPLLPYVDDLIKTADRYGLDYRLLPAIAQQESNLCKVIPPGSFNCWGWGINSQSNLGFDSFEEAIDTVAYGLKTQYIDKGYKSVPEIMSKYNPNSPDGAWGKGVVEFMSEMQ